MKNKTIFCFENFNQKSLNVSMLVIHVIVSLQQCFEVTRMVIKYHAQSSLIYFVYHVGGGSRIEHPNKRTISEISIQI